MFIEFVFAGMKVSHISLFHLSNKIIEDCGSMSCHIQTWVAEYVTLGMQSVFISKQLLRVSPGFHA